MEFYVPFFRYPNIPEFTAIKSWKVIDFDSKIRTGDLLFFCGSSFLSSSIKLFTGSRWNHIGMACWCELKNYDGKSYIDLFCFEMGSQPYTDLMTRKLIDKGVRLVRLADIANMYDIISCRSVKINRSKGWTEKFRKFMLKWANVPFPSILSLAKSYMISPTNNPGETTCSQLVALMFEEMNVTKLDFNPSQLCPDDLSSRSKAFDQKIFNGPESIIYSDYKKINRRLIFVSVVLIVILIILIVLLKKHYKKYYRTMFK